MIVIATNNGSVGYVSRGHDFVHDINAPGAVLRTNLLDDLITSIERIGYDEIVVVVDTGSTDSKSIEYIESLKSRNLPFRIIVEKATHKCYDTGAYIYTAKKYKSEYYIFLQDSVVIKDDNFVNDVKSRLGDNNVVPWLVGTGLSYDNEEQCNFVNMCIGSTDIDKLIFGPMFFIKGDVLERVINQISVLPSCKNEQSAMERGWGALFKKNNIDITPLEGEYDYPLIAKDGLRYLTKYHVNRQ